MLLVCYELLQMWNLKKRQIRIFTSTHILTHTKEIVKINTFYASSCSDRTSTVFSLWGFHWSNIAQNRTKFTWLLLVLAPPINKMCSAWETDPKWRKSTCKTAELLHIDTIPWSICWARTGQSTTPGNRALTWLFTVTLFSHISHIWTQKKIVTLRQKNERVTTESGEPFFSCKLAKTYWRPTTSKGKTNRNA